MANDSKTWRCGKYELSFDRPRIMGVINVTPDSFSDGGELFDPDAAIAAADALIVGGTSLVVYPAAGLTRYFTGDTLAICNLAPTDHDANADLLISCDIADAFAF